MSLIIKTLRLEVRHLVESDYADYRRLEGDAEVKKFTGVATDISKENYLKAISPLPISCLAVCANEDGRYIGRCGFRREGARIELELFLLTEVQGAGLGGELFDAMVAHCATAFPELEVAASVAPQNLRAVKLISGRGFIPTGEMIELRSGIPHAIYLKKSNPSDGANGGTVAHL